MMYKLKFRNKLKLVLNKYKRLIILLAAFLVTSLVVLTIFATKGYVSIPGLYGIEPVTLIIGLGCLVVIFILIYLN